MVPEEPNEPDCFLTVNVIFVPLIEHESVKIEPHVPLPVEVDDLSREYPAKTLEATKIKMTDRINFFIFHFSLLFR
jgi:hypothetical protein